jgi:hypothetical protein
MLYDIFLNNAFIDIVRYHPLKATAIEFFTKSWKKEIGYFFLDYRYDNCMMCI